MKTLLGLGLALLSGCVYGGGYEPVVVTRPAGAPAAPPLTSTEVERMAAAGVAEAVILDVVAARGARLLSADDIVAIKKAGGSDAVITQMQTNVRKEPEVVFVEQPVVYRTYAYGPYWYPSWGFGYSSWGHHSGWGVRVGW
jgi:hypothetical protein